MFSYAIGFMLAVLTTEGSACQGAQGFSTGIMGVGSYSANSDCYWALECSSDTQRLSSGGTFTADRATITFTDFDLESDYDFVGICEFAYKCCVILYVVKFSLYCASFGGMNNYDQTLPISLTQTILAPQLSHRG